LNRAIGKSSSPAAALFSRNPLLRLFDFGLALLLRNLWVLCRWIVPVHPGLGACTRHSRDISFELLLLWLGQCLTELLDLRIEIRLPAPSPSRF
jgi:hypothetical protein